jgi:tRNA 2-thiocytidine biosynthesis protein TtcA
MGSVEKQAFYLLKKVNKAIRDYDMIRDGDRIAVAVSGGKDSLSLLKLLAYRQSSVPERYDLLAIHVESNIACSEHMPRHELEHIFRELTVGYSFEQAKLSEQEDQLVGQAGCFRCSWHRRKALFQAAQRLGCSKVALGHHADDLAQTTLLNLVYHGRLETMAPKVSLFGGEIVVVRPLVYVPEKELVRFARACGFPVEESTCYGSQSSKRSKMKELLRTLHRECPQVKINLYRAVESYSRKDGT